MSSCIVCAVKLELELELESRSELELRLIAAKRPHQALPAPSPRRFRFEERIVLLRNILHLLRKVLEEVRVRRVTCLDKGAMRRGHECRDRAIVATTGLVAAPPSRRPLRHLLLVTYLKVSESL